MYVEIDGRSWNITGKDGWYKFFTYYSEHPESTDAQWVMENVVKNGPYDLWSMYEEWQRNEDRLKEAESSGDWNSYYRDAAHQGIEIDDAVEKYIDNEIANQRTEQAQQWEEHMRDTDTLSQGSQLTQLGLSPSGVLSIGGANHNGVSAADNSMSNLSHSASMMKYQQRMNLARGVLGMVSQMASSGIYGASIGAARNAAARLSTAAAHSGLKALQNMRPELRNQLMKDQAARDVNYDPYQMY